MFRRSSVSPAAVAALAAPRLVRGMWIDYDKK